MKGNIANFFPGGNTSKGFYSFYRYILSQDEARRIICLKGGPGTGKSSLMKKVGEFFNDRGYDIEYHHCSSDNNSLDGVVVKGLNVAILDGTAPHVVDPINPGAVDEILNMGECWDEQGFKKYRKNIIDANKEVGKTFKRAYRYLGAAKLVHDDWSNLNTEALSLSKLSKFKEDMKNQLFKTSLSKYGYERHLFATAFTPNGIITFIDTLYTDYKNVFILKGGPGTGKTNVLDFLSKEALKRGFYVETFNDPLVPERIEHVLIPDLSLALLTTNEINNKSFIGTEINMSDFQNSYLLNKNKPEMKDSIDNFYTLLNKGLKLISSAKFLHDDMEKYYVPNMDFNKVNATVESVINKLLGYEKEYLK